MFGKKKETPVQPVEEIEEEIVEDIPQEEVQEEAAQEEEEQEEEEPAPVVKAVQSYTNVDLKKPNAFRKKPQVSDQQKQIIANAVGQGILQEAMEHLKRKYTAGEMNAIVQVVLSSPQMVDLSRRLEALEQLANGSE